MVGNTIFIVEFNEGDKTLNTIEENLTKTKYKELVIYPTASVLVPTYNGERYLRKALDSVLQQTYTDFEIILIDDGSTDSTPQICDEYGQKYDFIRVVHQENIGLSKTRERLLEHATGKYIFWLDSDDYYDHTLLEKAVKVFEENSVDLVVWGYVQLSAQKKEYINPIEQYGFEEWHQMNFWGLAPAVWMYASRRGLWANLERFPEDVDLVDDVWLTSQVIPKTKKISSLGECLYYYDYTNVDSIMHSYTGKKLCRDALAFYRTIKRNQKIFPSLFPMSLPKTRTLLVNSYCIDQVMPSLSIYQKKLIREALKDLDSLFPQKRTKKFYFIQLCIIFGVDFVCRWYGRSRIRKHERGHI